MKKFASLLLVLALCMGLTVPALAADYGPLTINDMYGQSFTFEQAQTEKKSLPVQKYDDVKEDFVVTQEEFTVVTVQPGSFVAATPSYPGQLPDGQAYYVMNDVISPSDGIALYGEIIDGWFDFDWTMAFSMPIKAIGLDGTDGTQYLVITEGTDLPGAAAPAAPSFADVTAADYFYDSVNWAVDKAITNGTSATTFSPSATCTQAQIITFLWRANGSPSGFEPSGLGAAPTDYYYDAVNWAAAKGIIDATFSASAPCTRAAAVTYMYRNAGSPAVSYGGKFTDVSADATGSAVQWALNQGVTTGTSDVTFSPDATCTRGQIVTFLYRDLA